MSIIKKARELFKGDIRGNTVFITEKDDENILILFYTKVADEKIALGINKAIENKIDELAKKSIHNKVIKKYIDKRANEIFSNFLGRM